jgi:hypothetical protein
LSRPVDLVAVATLGAATAAIGNARHFRAKGGWVEGRRLWCASVCEPGPKKSPALAAATAPPRNAQRELERGYRASLGVCESAQDPGAGLTRQDWPRMRQLFTGYTTLEGLTGLLEDNARGLALIDDELSAWALSLIQYKRGKGNDRLFWISLGRGAGMLVNRAGDRGRPTAYIPNPQATGTRPGASSPLCYRPGRPSSCPALPARLETIPECGRGKWCKGQSALEMQRAQKPSGRHIPSGCQGPTACPRTTIGSSLPLLEFPFFLQFLIAFSRLSGNNSFSITCLELQKQFAPAAVALWFIATSSHWCTRAEAKDFVGRL